MTKQQDLEALLFDGLDLQSGLEEQLWQAANGLRANSTLKASEYATPVLGLIFLKYASNKFSLVGDLSKEKNPWDDDEEEENEDALIKRYISKCGFYLPKESRYDYLLTGQYKKDSEGKQSLVNAVIAAMEGIEKHNTNLLGTLPKEQFKKIPDDAILENLIREFSVISVDAEGDLFGKIYEYFLGKFALAEGQKGGQFFTPTSIVKLIVEVIEPFKGKIFDPSCGSGGMFVQSAKFIRRHQENGQEKDETRKLSIYGQEKMEDTVNLGKMNLAVNGLEGEIRNTDSYYNDPFEIDKYIDDNKQGPFDYIMANPPFNVKNVVEEKIKDSTRFNYFGLPAKASKTTSKSKKPKIKNIGNANYLWANLFGSALNETGRAGFVMTNSASDARGVELEVRKEIINKDLVDVMVAVSSNFFISVTLPITIWFYDKDKKEDRKKRTLFIDARNIYTQVNRAMRTFTQAQLFDISAIVWLYRGETDKYTALVDNYKAALEQWTNGTTINPKDKDRPYKGMTSATTDLTTALENWKTALMSWIKGLQSSIEKKDKVALALSEHLALVEALDTTKVVETYKQLQELSLTAEKKLKPKKDKTFSTLQLKNWAKKATAAHEHRLFIIERMEHFKKHLAWHNKCFPKGGYADVEGLCKIATTDEIADQNYSLNAGRYVGVALEEDNMTAAEFKVEMLDWHGQLLELNKEAKELEELIDNNLKEVL